MFVETLVVNDEDKFLEAMTDLVVGQQEELISGLLGEDAGTFFEALKNLNG